MIARRLFVTLLFALGTHAVPANATLLSGTQVFNVDLTAGTPAAVVNFSLFVNAGPGSFSINLFPDLNAGGTPVGIITVPVANSGFTLREGLGFPDFLDGLFSAQITLITGTLDVTLTAFTSATLLGAPILTVTPTLAAAAPEPGTLILLGLGLLTLALTRHRPGVA